jgi:hypothetical protein
MIYRGTISNGVVVFVGPDRPGEGTEVEVRPVGVAPPARSAGAGGRTLDEIARAQGVTRPAAFDELLGGSPEGEDVDGSGEAAARWRGEEPRRAEWTFHVSAWCPRT